MEPRVGSEPPKPSADQRPPSWGSPEQGGRRNRDRTHLRKPSRALNWVPSLPAALCSPGARPRAHVTGPAPRGRPGPVREHRPAGSGAAGDAATPPGTENPPGLLRPFLGPGYTGRPGTGAPGTRLHRHRAPRSQILRSGLHRHTHPRERFPPRAPVPRDQTELIPTGPCVPRERDSPPRPVPDCTDPPRDREPPGPGSPLGPGCTDPPAQDSSGPDPL